MAGCDDGRVACTDQEIIIRHYYPLGAKHIKYQAIRQVRVAPLGPAGHHGRLAISGPIRVDSDFGTR